MKTSLKLVTLAGLLVTGLLNLNAADNKLVGGPKGGRLLEKTEPRAEFYVEKDHSVTITFYDAALKPVAVTGQNVTVIADAKGGKAKLEFEKSGDVLRSTTKLPEGDGYNVVVRVRAQPDGKPQNFRFKLDQHTCAECHRAEYGCICDH